MVFSELHVVEWISIGYIQRGGGLYGIYTTSGLRPSVVYTVGTDTELYNQLVPWGIATRLRSSMAY